jgi:hypothetical protein
MYTFVAGGAESHRIAESPLSSHPVATRHGLTSACSIGWPFRISSFPGKVNGNTASLSSFASTHSRPPWASMMDRQIDSPIPTSLKLRVRPRRLAQPPPHRPFRSARRAIHRPRCGRFGRPMALVGISRGDFLRGVPAGRYRADRRGLRLPRSARARAYRDLLCASRSGCRYSWPVPLRSSSMPNVARSSRSKARISRANTS